MPELHLWLFPLLGAATGLVAHALFRLAFPEPQPAPARATPPRRRARGTGRLRQPIGPRQHRPGRW